MHVEITLITLNFSQKKAIPEGILFTLEGRKSSIVFARIYPASSNACMS